MLPQPVGVQTRATSPVSAARSKTRERLYACDPILKRLPQNIHDMAAELWPFIQEEHAMVGQRHVTQHRHVAPADQSCIRDGVMGTRHGRVMTHAVGQPSTVAAMSSTRRSLARMTLATVPR
jgi:hypothetical protein